MADLPIITVTSITYEYTCNKCGYVGPSAIHDECNYEPVVVKGFANAEQMPEIEPYDDGCDGEGCAACRPTEGPCPFDAVLVEHEKPPFVGLPVVIANVEATVTDLHHADECEQWDGVDRADAFPTGKFCHPDAKLGQWHLHFKEADRD